MMMMKIDGNNSDGFNSDDFVSHFQARHLVQSSAADQLALLGRSRYAHLERGQLVALLVRREASETASKLKVRVLQQRVRRLEDKVCRGRSQKVKTLTLGCGFLKIGMRPETGSS
jgi:hypothetical protein